MAEENVALARKAIDALDRGEFDAFLAFLSPDVVWEALEGVPGIGELYRGRAGVREWIELMSENAEEGVHIEIEQITDLGDDRVFIAVVLTARRRGSGVPFEYRTWQIVWFGDGRLRDVKSSGPVPKPSRPPGFRSRRCRRRTSDLRNRLFARGNSTELTGCLLS